MLHQAALATMLALAAAVAQPAVPDTAATRMMNAWLDVFNRGDRDALRQFDETSFPSRAKSIDQDVAFRAMTGGFELKKIEESSPTHVAALVQERDSDQFARLVLDVDAAQPKTIASLGIRAIPRPAEFPIPHLTETELRAAAERQAQAAASADRFSGAVLIAKNGAPTFAKAYGSADREHGVPNTLDTRFRIGSMNKMFTAVATMSWCKPANSNCPTPSAPISRIIPTKRSLPK